MRIKHKTENLRDRLVTTLDGYFQDIYEFDVDRERLADYLMETIDELHTLKLIIGTKIKIKSDLEENKMYGGHSVTDEMLNYCGKEAVITNYEYDEDCEPAYLLDIDDEFWSWSDEMFE